MSAVAAQVLPHRPEIVRDLVTRFPDGNFVPQNAADAVPTWWVPAQMLHDVLHYLKYEIAQPYRMLFDLTAVDERLRKHREGLPAADFTLVYQLLSLERNADVRIKVALRGEYPSIKSIVGLFVNANWYEREVWDLFGITFEGHPRLRRILLPPTWQGHPLRKE